MQNNYSLAARLCHWAVAVAILPSSVVAQVCNPGNVVVADLADKLVEFAATPGASQQVISSPTQPVGADAHGGFIYTFDSNSGGLYRFDCSNLSVSPYSSLTGVTATAIDSQRSLLYAANGDLWKLDLVNGGAPVQVADSGNVPDLNSTTDLAVDENGCVILSVAGGTPKIVRIPSTGICSTPGGAPQTVATTPDVVQVGGLDVNRTNGRIYVADGGRGGIVEISSSGSPILLSTGAFVPGGLVVNQNTGDVFVAGGEVGQPASVVRVVPLGGAVTTITSGGHLQVPSGITIMGSANICGNGALEAGEACDDGNLLDGDCCSSVCQFEPIDAPCDDGNLCNGEETCNGAGVCFPSGDPLSCDDGNPCTADACDENAGCSNPVLDDGTSCNDNDLCTQNDQCQVGVCTGGGAPTCNDGDPCTADFCSPSVGCTSNPGPRPVEGAMLASVQQIVVKNLEIDKKDALVWKFNKGPAVVAADLGNPVTGSTAYGICAWETVNGGTLPFFSQVLPAGGLCNGKPCWKYSGKATDPKGVTYGDSLRVASGIKDLKIQTGIVGKSSLKLNIGGDNFPAPPGGRAGGAQLLSQDQEVIIQVENSHGKYWQSRFLAPAETNTEEQFMDK